MVKYALIIRRELLPGSACIIYRSVTIQDDNVRGKRFKHGMKQLIALQRDTFRFSSFDKLSDLPSNAVHCLEQFFIRLAHVCTEESHYGNGPTTHNDGKTERAFQAGFFG